MLKVTRAMIAPTCAERGHVPHDVDRSRTDENVLGRAENRESQAALDAHSKTAHLARHIERDTVPGLAAPFTLLKPRRPSPPGVGRGARWSSYSHPMDPDPRSTWETYLPALCEEPRLRAKFQERFGDRTDAVVARLLSPAKLDEEGVVAYDLIDETLQNEAELLDSWTGYGGDGDEFDIEVYRFGPVCWTDAIEFDTTCYDDYEKAVDRALDIAQAFSEQR